MHPKAPLLSRFSFLIPQPFDITGLFGVFCRHHHFLLGANMYGGEKYAYGALLLLILLLTYPHLRLGNGTYDIGVCLWGPWLEIVVAVLKASDVPALASAADALAELRNLMAPFHRNDHKMQCQVKHDVALQSGAGVQHGEAPEQKWSAWGRVAPKTKGMALAGRHVLLECLVSLENTKQRVC